MIHLNDDNTDATNDEGFIIPKPKLPIERDD